MKLPSDTHQKMMSAFQLLQQDAISIGTFEHIRTIVKGIHPRLDEKLELCSDALSKLQKIQNGDIITLSAETLPEETEEEKKRKKLLLFFISSVKDLKNEIQRIDAEFTQANKHGGSTESQFKSWGRIIRFAKGPFGIVTIAALLIIGLSLLFAKKATKTTVVPSLAPTVATQKSTIQVILYNRKQIPLTQLRIAQAHFPGCDGQHYHALQNDIVTAVDGTVLVDPGGCGFGKVNDMQVVDITK